MIAPDSQSVRDVFGSWIAGTLRRRRGGLVGWVGKGGGMGWGGVPAVGVEGCEGLFFHIVDVFGFVGNAQFFEDDGDLFFTPNG